MESYVGEKSIFYREAMTPFLLRRGPQEKKEVLSVYVCVRLWRIKHKKRIQQI
jgi:hypothetical protein